MGRTRASSSRFHSWDLIPDKVWNRIWAIQTLPKIKSLFWQLCNEVVATGASLVSRSVWFGCQLQYSPPSNPNLTKWIGSWDVLVRADKIKAGESLARASFVYWYLWRARNELAFNGKSWTPVEVIAIAEKAFLEFSEATGSSAANRIKANCNAALGKENSRGGLGIVFRDHTGSLKKAILVPLRLSSVLQGELMAIRTAVFVALEEGFTHLQVETDSMVAVELIHQSNSVPPTDVVNILSDIHRLSASFSSIVFSCIPRDLNSVADTLARKALPLVCETDWPISILWLHDLCVNEATGCTHPRNQ
ncbi:uncharacterized protein LOC122655400 [Telopea speciosissima]|uniref:uncharacterized protein LOC122655400 n=1 Tax=Telopea speciosissima TaxID=54955 RepID=UPI001CC4AF5E|nr:uncharacterized protein LOC122655400 [Telopea speciosissima]